ncbi:MAG: hypothetical protein IJ695_01425 [Butyrivibrio sp.]|nr:hypothetical protein [Butyrivibrio sp.]
MTKDDMIKLAGKEIENAIKDLEMEDHLAPNHGWWGRHPISGRFSYLMWWEVKILDDSFLRDELRGYYSSILFTPYRVDRKVMDNISDDIHDNIVELSNHYDHHYWGKENAYSEYNVDVCTGNVHMSFSEDEWCDDCNNGKTGLINQLILCGKKECAKGQNGPKLGGQYDVLGKDRSIVFRRKGSEDIVVPKCCHYPELLSDEGGIMTASGLLKGMLSKISVDAN